MKAIAFYLPQYHAIPENDEWWGKGFTEWTNVRKAKPVYPGQTQPRVPLGQNYYNLLDDQTKLWQAELAKKAGIYGFCYYHYWFNGKMLLEKPAEQMLRNPAIDLPFCFSWANEPWSRSWKGDTKNVLMAQEYGDQEDWKRHFDYLLPFFQDKRYIREQGKPMLILYKPDIIPCCGEMIKYWNELAQEAGFPGLYIGFQFPSGFRDRENETRFDFAIEFEPLYTKAAQRDFLNISTGRGKLQLLRSHPLRFAKTVFRTVNKNQLHRPTLNSYERICREITSHAPRFKNAVPGMYAGWDKTPRNGTKAEIDRGSTPALFEKYLQKQVERAAAVYHSEYLFITAWNEWGEGAYLEPDEEFGMGYLEAAARVLK